MGVLSITVDVAGQTGNLIGGVAPRRVAIISTDNLATVTTAGYLNPISLEGYTILPTDVIDMYYGYSSNVSPGTFAIFTPSISNGIITLVEWINSGDVLLPVVSGDFANFNGTSGQIKDAGFSPSSASKTKVVMANGAVTVAHIGVFTDTAGTLGQDAATAINGGNIQAGLSGTAGTLASFPATASNGSLIVKAINNSGGFNSTISNTNIAQATVYSIPDPGAATANFVLDVTVGGQVVSSSSASAAPGTLRAFTGSLTLSNANYSNGSNSVAGLRGVVNMVGASVGFIYGTQGKVIATGTLGGSVWIPAIFGQLDLSAANVNGCQVSPIWGDFGTTIGTATDLSLTRGIVLTNTTTRVINSQVYLVGGATNLFELTGGGNPITYALSAGAGSIGANPVKLKIMVDGNPKYLICADDWT